MLPLVYKTVRTPAVIAQIKTRIYRHGAAPQTVQRPYVTWFVVSGQPFDTLVAPCGDRFTVQIDCWSESDIEVEQLASSVRTALDTAQITNTIAVNSYEPETKLYRIGLQADFIDNR